MSRPTTHDQRKFIEIKVKDGWTSKAISEALGISKKTVDKWRQRLKKMDICALKWVVLLWDI